MAKERVGIWLIGAWGGVATTSVVGLAALKKGLTSENALITSTREFEQLSFCDWDQLIIGGHELRDDSYWESATRLHDQSRVFTLKLLNEIREDLTEIDENIQVGSIYNAGNTIEQLSSDHARKYAQETASEAISRIQQDLENFTAKQNLDRLLVINLASTEPTYDVENLPTSWEELNTLISQSDHIPLPPSCLYAIAAFQAGCPFINFTPSTGSDLPAIAQLAEQNGLPHCGRDGKTGETLLKSVLAPMFAARNLNVMSWVGHNIFGNMDGVVLNDPTNKASKVKSKDHLLTEILGYSPQTLVSIEYIQSMADWKTAWDHIHFQGFLDTPMTMQFTWQGCDSLLAAPLVLDLIRLVEYAHREGESGVLPQLACFFKSPMSADSAEFALQFEALRAWAQSR